ncbi:MAG: beta-lactamase family protein, partial [Gemmatimonadaceae bacterium]|nr:beta-lactamase family protein [Gemmatimonadaceae bacterium]
MCTPTLPRRFAPGFCLAILLFPGAVPVEADGQRPSTAARRAAHAGAYLERLQPYGFSGVVLVARGAQVLYRDGHGMADRENRVPFRASTLFDVGSLTKQFTAAAVLKLASEGKLAVTDSIGRFFADVPPGKRGITVHQLLTHTAGITDDQLTSDYVRVSRDSMIARTMRAKLLAAPGEQHAYSNVGYSVLAAIVEQVTGESYEAFLRRALFRPAGLRETGYTIPVALRAHLATGYRRDVRWGIGADSMAATGGDAWNLIGNGGLYSSVGDLQRWTSALLDGRVLPREWVARMLTPHVLAIAEYRQRDAPLYYGYGWYVWRPAGRTVVFHDGGNGISYASVRLYRDDNTTLVYASNTSAYAERRDLPVEALNRIMLGDTVA